MASELGRRPPPHERRVLQLALLAGLPGGLLGVGMLWASEWSLALRLGLTGTIVVFWLGFARAVQLRVAHIQKTHCLCALALDGA